MKLGAFLWATGHHIAAWRHPKAHVTAGIDIDHYIQLARTAEAAKFDMIFCEDAAGLREANVGIASQTSRSIGFEPISLLSALAVQTSRIGLVSTASTSYNEPYGLARTFLSLDQSERRPRRLEPGHLGQPDRSRQFRLDRPQAPCRPLRAGA